jgi:hypothetical protein
MRWVRRQPCAVRPIPFATLCYGPVEADHAGRRGIGQKADDTTCIPLCRRHHGERGSFTFRLFDQERMRAWLDSVIQATRSAFMESTS